MKVERAVVWILVACLVCIFLLGLWMMHGPVPVKDDGPPLATPEESPTKDLATPTPVAVRTAAIRHRLAGTVVGDVRYAVIEAPDGESDLYRPGQTVPGLGRLLRVDPTSAILEGEHGRIEIRLAPAPTAPPSPSPPRPVLASPSPATTPQAPARTPPGAPPSSAPDQSAS
jgi:hypothetical protein